MTASSITTSAVLPWAGFLALVLVLILVDLGVSGRRHAPLGVRAALIWSSVWIALATAFGGVVWWMRGAEGAVQYYTAWLLEKSLSVDNLFVFLLIFSHNKVPAAEQHRVLTWGILGALVMRAVMIFAGVELLQHWHWVNYLFAAFLVITGVRAVLSHERREDIEPGRIVTWLGRVLPIAHRYEGGRFFTREKGRLVGTLLLWTLVMVEVSDVLFAVDSIPAVFGVTQDPFIVFTSNIMAILGLCALFFALAGLLVRLRYLHYGLGAILVLIGAKMVVGMHWTIPALWSLGATVGILAVTVLASLVGDHKHTTAPPLPRPKPESVSAERSSP